MLLPSLKYAFAIVAAGLAVGISPAAAGLYGFAEANPLTKEEKILEIDYLPMQIRNYRSDLRENLLMLIDYARKNNPDFKVIAHEGQELLYRGEWEEARDGYNLSRQKKGSIEDTTFLRIDNEQPRDPKPDSLEYNYLKAIDALALNGLFCGQGKEQRVTFNNNLGLISIDYCASSEDVDRAIVKSFLDKKIVYAFDKPEGAFNNIENQPLINDSAENIWDVKKARNILFLTDDSNYASKEKLVEDLSNTNYDIIVVKPLFHNAEPLSNDDIYRMQFKKNGARRLVIAEMNVTEVSPRDYFWNSRWQVGNPSWLARKSFVDKDAVIVEYWNEEWRKIMSKHFRDIVVSGYNGVFFTGLHNHFYFEHQTPLE